MNETDNVLLVESLGGEPSIVEQAGREREFRKVTNVFRGPARVAIEKLIAEALTSPDTVRRPVPDTAASTLGTRGVATPILGVDNVVYGAHVCGQDPELLPRTCSSEPGNGNSDWTGCHHGCVPPGHSSTCSASLGRVVRLSDIAELWHRIKTAKPGDSSTGTFVIRTDAGELRHVHYAQRYVATAAGPRMRGLCRATTAEDGLRYRASLHDTDLSRALIGLQGIFGMVGDITIPNAPCILKWLTSHVPGIGHGVSTGQTPAIHPDDMPQVLQWIEEVRDNPHPVTGMVRLRRGGGGWIKAKFIAQLLDPEAFPTLGVALIYPDSLAEEDVQEIPEPR